MSIRDRYAELAPWIVTAIGLCLCAAIAFSLSYSLGYQAANEDRQADYKAYDVAEKAHRECAAKSSVEEALRCYTEAEKASREDHRAEQDLNAQRQMADWAKWMFYATAIIGALTVGVTGVGVYFVRKTLVETQRTTWFADKTAREATRANNIARSNVRVARESAERQLQVLRDTESPHIFIENVRAEVPITIDWFDIPEEKLPFWDVLYDTVNYGRTPAIIVETRAGLYFGNMLSETPEWFPGEIHVGEWVIAGGSKRTSGAFYRGKITHQLLNDVWCSQTYDPKCEPTKIFFYGYVRYRGVNGTEDHIGFCYEYRPHPNVFILEDRPNYSYRRRGLSEIHPNDEATEG